MGTKTSIAKALPPIPWRDPDIDGLTVIELKDEEAEAQWMAAFYSMHVTQEERDEAPTTPLPLGKS